MEPIAIIGMGCRFPGADNPDRFWQLLAEAGDAIREVPAERWDLDRFFDPDPERPGRMNTRWGGFLDGVDRFDPEFFGISSREAAHMDPQQRLALEVAWEAVEDAGLARHHLAGTATGVFIGVSNFDYSRLGGHDTESIGIHSGIGTALSIVANRVSYLLDLRGPSVVVDTACSSSLVAVHLACQSLQNGESQMALAGGVNLMLGPEPMIAFSKARMMADDGRCKAFDDRANGYVRGEGAGIVVLKPLPAAHADRDPIVAVIRGGAMNQDGFTNGLTAPNPAAQKAVIRQACRSAGIAPGQLDYVEAHGTGTHLGDPIEAKALGEVLANGRPSGDRCAIGSVKTNIGHLESAAGIAGLIKVALALKNRQIPASLHFARPNRYIPFDTLPLRVQEKLAPWPEHAGPALAGVSSFGFGGTNVHVILEAPPPRPPAAQRVDRPHHILTLSAKGKTPLRALAQRYDACLARHPELDPGDLCFTANARRSHFRHHVALTGENLARLRDGLAAFVAGTPAPGLHHGVAPQRRPTVAFLFTGQGAQYPDMGRSLYQTQPVFKRVMDRCDEVLRRHLDRPLLSVLYDDAKSQDQLDQTGYTQPALFALECGLAELWRSWGIKPDIVLGHSIGEYAAACVAGAFSLEEGLVLVAERARLMQALPAAGMMAAAFVDESRVREVLADSTESVALAALNGPRNTVISGERAAVERALERLRAARVRARALPVSHAFHSPLVEPMLDAFEAAVGRTTIRPLRLPLVSNLNGEVLQPGSVLDARYWRRHTREPVRFAAGIAGLLDLGHRLFLELGPRPALSGIGRQCRGDASATWLASLRPGMEDWRSLLDSLAALYVRGARVDWDGFDQDYARRRLHLPTYPFDRRRCWMGAEDTTMTQSTPQANTPEPSERAPVPQARREIIVSLLRSLAGDILWTDSATVDPKTPFVELGADSVVLIELVTKIESALGVQLPVRRFYEDLTTIDALADFLERSLPPEWEAGHSPRPDRDPARGASRPGTRPEAAPGALEAPGVVDPPMKSAEDRAPISSTGRERDATERLFQRQLDLLSRVMARQLEVLEQAAAPDPAAKASRSGPAKAPEAPAAAPAPTAAGRPLAAVPVDADPRQQRHLRTLARRYNRRTARSKRFAEKFRPMLADRRGAAGFRPSIKEMLYPIVGKRASGAHIWDIDDNEYVDLAMGFGVHLFGHNPAFVKRALKRQLDEGFQLGPQARRAGAVAEAIGALTGTERVVFCNSGTEAVMTALRLARTATGRSKIAMFAGAYHGHFDGTLALPRGSDGDMASTPLAPGVTPHMVEDVLVLPYGDPQSLANLRARSGELAAILVEPVQSRRPDLQPGNFLRELRRLATEAGAALIFDEILTGFRIAPGGAQEWFGVQADVATYGKLIGGGLPIGIVAGKAAYLDGIDGGMWRYGDASFPGAETTFFAGTFNKNPLTMAAARAVLAEIKRRGPALQDNLNRRTAALVDRLNAVFGEQDVPLRVANFGSIFRFEFTGNLDVFFYHLLDRGIYLWEGRTCFLSTAHRESDTARVVEAVRSSIEEMRAGGFLPAGRRQPAAAGPGRSPRAPKPEVPELVRLGADGLEVKLAESRAEIARVQELRYHVFYGEMGAKPTPETAESHRDFDEFDELCDHLLVIERERGRVVGTYRLLRREAIGNHSFYSANEFDIAPVLAFEGEILELGRACVAQAYRNGTTMQLLWRGITAYARRHRVGLMFGCASLPGTDPRPVAEQLGYLYHYHLAPPGLRVQALPDRYVDMKGTDVRKIDPQRAIAGLPPLVRGYLRLGAFVGDGAVVDEQFNTTDVAIVLRTDWVTQDLDQLIAEGRLFAAQGLARGGQG